MNAANLSQCLGLRQAPAANRLISAMNERAEGGSPLEAARQALLEAKSRLEAHRDERIEQALDGYRALRSRQTSYEEGLRLQEQQRNDFQALTSRRDALSEQLSAARADCEAYAASGSALDINQYNRLSQRAGALESELSSACRDISALVEQANRCAASQRQYADYLERTGQGGYAAFAYREAAEYSEANFASETAGMMERMRTGAEQWRERVSSYCAQYGRTPYGFECYLLERQTLGDAYGAARQRLAELLYAAERAAPREQSQPPDGEQRTAPAPRANFDTVELGGDQQMDA